MKNFHGFFSLKTAFLLFLLVSSSLSLTAQDSLLNILSDELMREMNEFKKLPQPPYYISYRVDDEHEIQMEASLGVLVSSTDKHSRSLRTQVRMGSYKLDNTHELRSSSYDYSYNREINLPVENQADAIRQALWKSTDDEYKKAVVNFGKVEGNVAVMIEEEDRSDDFSSEIAEVFYEPPVDPSAVAMSASAWEDKLVAFSALFLENKDIYLGKATMVFQVIRRYFVSSEGAKIVQNLTYTRLFIQGEVKADDGMTLPLYLSYFAFEPQYLPADEKIREDIRKMIEKLSLLRKAPVVEPYTGPAILSGEAAGVFFHEIFGHRVEGHRQKSEYEGQTFKKKVNQKVISEDISVYFDPQLRNYKGYDLNGYYKFDDEGVKGQKVDVIISGTLKEFLMSRSPIAGFSKSNGHGRAADQYHPVSRQSNMIITVSKNYSTADLRKMLIDECVKQKLEYGYLFEEVRGGFTMTGRFMPNSFNVIPLLVYRIYVDGRPDEIVRGVDLVGTPLSMFSQIKTGGGDLGLFTGYCGAESGSVPVSSVSPAVFVKQIEMQKKSKDQTRPFILPRPEKEQNKTF